MRKITGGLRKFFLPGADAPLWVRLLPFAVLGFLSLFVLVSGAYAWDYTNSSAFCGTSCHTMPPEYTAYLISPHARVACVECHIGRDFIATQITRKAGDLKHVIYTITQDYEYPITAREMRPARETCERCHNPEKFSDDSLRIIRQYGNDADNTLSTIHLIVKTGGGSKRQGLGRGIHWHVENQVLYYATDNIEQEIPYVLVYNDDGTIDEFTDVESNFDLNTISEDDLKEMDCITCHNRITHLVPVPEDSVDSAIFRKLIDVTIPEIRRLSVEALRGTYTSEEEALQAIAAIEDFYKQNYSDYYAENSDAIAQSILTVQDIYNSSVYMEQKSDWNSHPNNLGHTNSPGCFRCHDGKHLNEVQEAVRIECNLCHAIPSVSGPQDFIQTIEISMGPEPQSHLSSTWIPMHYQAFDATCSSCHDTSNPGGTDNSSFCSNSACHGNVWEFAGFDAPALREIIEASLPEPTESPTQPTATPAPATESAAAAPTYDNPIQDILKDRCTACHGQNGMEGLNLLTYEDLMKGGSSGPVVIEGDPDNSLIMKKQTAQQPHFGQLSTSELQILREWILAGAPEK